jgi:TolB-like protein/class 3 adenylate cyclase
MSQSRQLAAIMFTDIVGYTALMGRDERKAFELLDKNRQIQKPIIEQFNGRWIKELGDGVMASFNTVSDAVNAAIKIQQTCNASKEFQLRIGIHLGEVVFENDDVFGDGVNIASRIEAIANPGSVFISESVYHNVQNKKEIQTKFVKEEILKNVKEPVRIYEVITGSHQAILPQQIKTVSEKSIAVLPFANMSSDPEQEYFSDGITEEIITDLSRLQDMLVISRSSAMTFKNTNKKIKDIGRDLNVHYVLEGSVRKAGNNLRITAQLIDASNDLHVWADKYNGTLDDVFEIQEKVSRAIVDSLKIELSPSESRHIADRSITNSKAYDTWKQAMYEFRKFSEQGIERGIMLAKKAIEIEGENAYLYSSLGLLYWAVYDFGIHHNKETLDLIEQYTNKALKLNSTLPQALFVKGLTCYKRGDMAGFIRNAKHAVELGTESESQCIYSCLLAEIGKTDKAIYYAEGALARDPFDFLPWWSRSFVDLFECKPDLAFNRIRDARNRLAPGEPFAGWWVAQMAAYAGELDAAYEEFTKVASVDGGLWTDFSLLFKRALDNDHDELVQHLKTTNLTDYALTDEYYSLYLASALTLVNEYDEAIRWIKHSINWGFSNYKFLQEGNRFFQPLHDHLLFQDLINTARQQQHSLMYS